MKLISLINVCKQLNIKPATLWHFVVYNDIPIHQRKPKLLLNLNINHPFLQATKYALSFKCPIFYTIPEVAAMSNLDSKTIKKYLHQYDIPIQNEEKRGYIYITDFLHFMKRQDNLSTSFVKHMNEFMKRSKNRENINK